MKLTPMEQVLEQLIAEGEDGVAAVQIVFTPGIQSTAGALKRGPVERTYCLGAMGHATEDMPGKKAGELIMTEQIFEASAVQRVMRAIVPEAPSAIYQGTH